MAGKITDIHVFHYTRSIGTRPDPKKAGRHQAVEVLSYGGNERVIVRGRGSLNECMEIAERLGSYWEKREKAKKGKSPLE